ncbi:MAG TPA: CoA pyrophosphatase [Thermoplasmata archaeon]|nr:CoA pyrophosphatase [Thermoplasmata archaeon]
MPPGASAGTAPRSIDDLLARHEDLTPPVGTAGAAVTILLRDGRSDVEILLIERTERETDPASGQVAFPGGRVDDGDSSMRATALRELQEEVGLTAADLAGPPRYVTTANAARFHLKVAIFVAALGPNGQPPTARSADEVAHVFWLPRSALANTVRVHRETGLGLLEVPATVYEGHVLWGFTRRCLREFFGLPTEDEWAGPAFAVSTPEPAEEPGDGRPPSS